MTAGEELLLLLELNGFEVAKYKLKKQLEFEKTGNIDLYNHKKLSKILLSHYSYEDDKDFFHRNPLMYSIDWGETIVSIDQFFVTHPDLPNEITIKEFLQIKDMSEITRESILYDVFDEWIEEYRELSIVQMENLREMVNLLPKKKSKYRKPSKFSFFTTLFLALILVLIYKNPSLLQPKLLQFFGDFVYDMHGLLYESLFFSFIGVLSIIALITYAILNNLVARLIKDTRLDKNKRIIETFDRWDQDIKTLRINQAGYLEDYVDQVMQDPSKSELDITRFAEPEKLLFKFKEYVRSVEYRFDWSKKNYAFVSKVLRLIFFGAVFFNLLFYIVGIALKGGAI